MSCFLVFAHGRRDSRFSEGAKIEKKTLEGRQKACKNEEVEAGDAVLDSFRLSKEDVATFVLIFYSR